MSPGTRKARSRQASVPLGQFFAALPFLTKFTRGTASVTAATESATSGPSASKP
jgi:hypothetical protein